MSKIALIAAVCPLLKKGGHFLLTRVFAKAGTRQVEVSVEGIGAMGPNNQSGSGMPMPMHH